MCAILLYSVGGKGCGAAGTNYPETRGAPVKLMRGKGVPPHKIPSLMPVGMPNNTVAEKRGGQGLAIYKMSVVRYVTQHLTFRTFVCLAIGTTYSTGSEGQNLVWFSQKMLRCRTRALPS